MVFICAALGIETRMGIVVYRDKAGDGNVIGTLTFTNIETIVACFTPGTMIATPKGPRPIEGLQKGDQVITGGGIVGKVVRVEDDKVVVEIASGIEVTAVKATLQQVVVKPEPGKPAHQEKKKSEKNDNRLPSKDQIANDN